MTGALECQVGVGMAEGNRGDVGTRGLDLT